MLPPERPPGTVFKYNQPATYSIAAIIQRVTGQRLTEYLRPRLFDPLGIAAVGWQDYPDGREVGFTGLHATTDAVARLGMLYLQGGVWQGEQVLPADWVAEATRAHIANLDEPNPDWQQGYGYQFWMARHGYRGDGAYGQFCIVLPEQDTVIAITSANEDMQSVLDAVWEHVLPALGPEARPDGAADAALADRLARLELPAVVGAPHPVDESAWTELSFTPADGRGDEQSSLAGIGLRYGAGSWQISLRDAESELPFALGTDGWLVSENAPQPGEGVVPVAASGGWIDPDALRFDVIFVETPHRLEVRCVRSRGTFVARWITRPMHGDQLRTLRSPVRGPRA